MDEAFIDATPESGVTQHAGKNGLIILRSMGKFFGLAGIRTGFVLAWPELLSAIQDELGSWTTSGPARWVASQALQDQNWHALTRENLGQSSQRLQALLSQHELTPTGLTELFAWIKTDKAAAWHEALARHGILTRYFAAPSSIRFGLPGGETDWQRLENVLGELNMVLETAVFTNQACLSG